LKNTFLDFDFYQTNTNTDFTLLGNHKKQMLIVIVDEAEQNDANIAFLEKIIAAIKYDFKQDTAYFFLQKEEKLTISDVVSRHQIKDLLVFGINNTQLGIYANQKKYQPFYIQQVTYIFADNLSEIQAQKELKGALWDALKKVFL
jgi:hypothetical protein